MCSQSSGTELSVAYIINAINVCASKAALAHINLAQLTEGGQAIILVHGVIFCYTCEL